MQQYRALPGALVGAPRRLGTVFYTGEAGRRRAGTHARELTRLKPSSRQEEHSCAQRLSGCVHPARLLQARPAIRVQSRRMALSSRRAATGFRPTRLLARSVKRTACID